VAKGALAARTRTHLGATVTQGDCRAQSLGDQEVDDVTGAHQQQVDKQGADLGGALAALDRLGT